MESKIEELQLENLLNLIRELVDQLSLAIMDSNNLVYLVDTLLSFEQALFQSSSSVPLKFLQTLFLILEKSSSNLLASGLLLKALKR